MVLCCSQAANIGLACWTMGSSDPACDWSPITADKLWQAADLSPKLEQQWHAGVGERHTALFLASLLVVVAAFAGLVRPVKMVAAGQLLLVVLLYNRDNTEMLPTLMLSCFLGELPQHLGDAKVLPRAI